MIRFFSAWSCLDCFQRGFCDITSIKCNSVTSKIFQKCLIIVPKVWEVTHNVFHHSWHIYQMDFYHFFSSTKDFTFDFSMSLCYTRYRSEEISPLRHNLQLYLPVSINTGGRLLGCSLLQFSHRTNALSPNGSLLRDPGPYRDLFGVLGPYWVSIYISGSLFSVFWLHSREECQFSLHVYSSELT